MMQGYKPSRFLAIVDGVPVVDPADVDDAFMAGYTNPRSRAAVGLYGAGGNEFDERTDGTFVIKVKGKSPDNDRFTAIMESKREVMVKFVNKNSNTDAAFTIGANAAVREFDGVGGGLSQPDRTWTFGSPQMKVLPGGNKLI